MSIRTFSRAKVFSLWYVTDRSATIGAFEAGVDGNVGYSESRSAQDLCKIWGHKAELHKQLKINHTIN